MPTFKAGQAHEYLVALNTHNAAIRTFEQAKLAYRARQIDDDTFLAAKAIYDRATAEFDAAYTKETK